MTQYNNRLAVGKGVYSNTNLSSWTRGFRNKNRIRPMRPFPNIVTPPTPAPLDDTTTASPLVAIPAVVGTQGGVAGFAYAPDGKLHVTTFQDKIDVLEDGVLLDSYPDNGNAFCMKFTKDGEYLVAGGIYGVLSVFKGKELVSTTQTNDGQAYQVDVLEVRRGSGETMLLIGTASINSDKENEIVTRIWSFVDRTDGIKLVETMPDYIYSLDFSPIIDDTAVSFAGGSGASIYFFKIILSNLDIVQTQKIDDADMRYAVMSVDYNANGSRIVTAGQDGRVKQWDLSGQLLTRHDQAHKTGVYTHAAYSPDGKYIVSGADTGSNIKIWDSDAYGGQPLRVINAGGTYDAGFSPNGLFVTTFSTQTKNVETYRVSE